MWSPGRVGTFAWSGRSYLHMVGTPQRPTAQPRKPTQPPTAPNDPQTRNTPLYPPELHINRVLPAAILAHKNVSPLPRPVLGCEHKTTIPRRDIRHPRRLDRHPCQRRRTYHSPDQSHPIHHLRYQPAYLYQPSHAMALFDKAC